MVHRLPVNLHIGCGPRNIEGWIHVDLSDYPHVDCVHDIRSLPMYDDGTVDLIYASHVLEYFDHLEVVDVLKEWCRVLRLGGTLRLAVPDFATMVKVYEDTHNVTLLLGLLYGRWATEDMVIYHRTVYDYASLCVLLRVAGFQSIRKWDWRETEHADVDDYSRAYYPHMDEEGTLLSLNVEADK